MAELTEQSDFGNNGTLVTRTIFTDVIPINHSIIQVVISDDDMITEKDDQETGSVMFSDPSHFQALNLRIHQLQQLLAESENVPHDTATNINANHQLPGLTRYQRIKEEIRFRLEEIDRLSAFVSDRSNGVENDFSNDEEQQNADYLANVFLATFNMRDGILDLETPYIAAKPVEMARMLKSPAEKHEYSFFKKLVVRQFYIGKVLLSDEGEHVVSGMELLLDLFYVLCVAQIGHLLKKTEPTLQSLNEFFMVFIPVFVQWTTTTAYTNRFLPNVSDAYHTLLLTINMALLLSMRMTVSSAFGHAASTTTLTEAPSELQHLATRSVGGSGGSTGSATAQTFLAVYMATRVLGVAQFLNVFIRIPRFRQQMGSNLLAWVAATIIWIICLALPTESNGVSGIGGSKMIAWWFGCFADMFFLAVGMILPEKLMNIKYRLAINVKHFAERAQILVIIIVGEIMASSTFEAATSTFNWAYMSTMYGLLMAVSLVVIYFRVEACREYRHAIRRHWLGFCLWTFAHLPLCAGLLCTGMAIGTLISHVLVNAGAPAPSDFLAGVHADVANSLKVQFFGSLALNLLVLTFIGALHEDRSSQKPFKFGSKTISVRQFTLGVRFANGIAMIICAIATVYSDNIPAYALLSIGTVLCVAQVIFEEWMNTTVLRILWQRGKIH